MASNNDLFTTLKSLRSSALSGLQATQDALHRHPRRVAAAVLAVLAGSTMTAFGVAPLTAAQLNNPPSISQISEALPLPDLAGQVVQLDEQGLSLARQFAMLSYRTPEEFGERFDAAPTLCNGHVRVAAEDYLDAAGAKFVARVSATAWLRLSESIDLHRVEPACIGVPTTVVAVEGDRLVPMSDAVTLVEGLGLNGRLRVLRSQYGHDAFLKETDRIDALLAGELQAGKQRPSPVHDYNDPIGVSV